MSTNYGGPVDWPEYDMDNVKEYFEPVGYNKETEEFEVREKKDTLSKKHRTANNALAIAAKILWPF